MDQFRAKSTAGKPQPSVERPAVQAVNNSASRKNNGSVKKYLLIAVVAAVILLAGAAFWQFVYKKDASLTGVDSSKYQALFLTNGQVYFGKLSSSDRKTIRVDNIFYLQVQQPVQPKADDDKAEGETQLIKLGQELHGPEDAMFVDRSQVLFWENLKNDGKVAQAITQYKQ